MGLPLMLLAPAAIQGASSLAQYLGRSKKGAFEDTPYGKYLRRLEEEGKYSPKAKSLMLGEVSGRAGALAQQQTASTRGYLESTGMGKSIAGAKLLSAPGRGAMREVAGTARNIELENELAKQQAGREYGTAATRWGEQRAGERTAARQQLVGGLGGALASGITAGVGYGAAKEAGVPYGLAPTEANLLRTQTMYGSRNQQPSPFELPDNFTSMNQGELFELSKNMGLDFEELSDLWYDTRASAMGGNNAKDYFTPGIKRPAYSPSGLLR